MYAIDIDTIGYDSDTLILAILLIDKEITSEITTFIVGIHLVIDLLVIQIVC